MSDQRFSLPSRNRPFGRMEMHALLLAHETSEQLEQSMLADMLAFVLQHEDCFERSLLVGHMTGSAWVLNAEGSHVLLTHHRKLNRWLQLGGHADGEPDLLKVALREAWEESGIADIVPLQETPFDIDIHRIPERGAEPAHFHYDVRYLLQAPSHARIQVSEESHAIAWVPLDGLAEREDVDEAMRRMVRKTVAWRK